MTPYRSLLLLSMVAAAGGQLAVSPSPVVVVGRAELLNGVRSKSVKEGDSFFLRTVGPWQQGDCVLPANTTLTGAVSALSLSGAGARRVSMTVQFSAVPCAGSRSMLITPLLVAVRAAAAGEIDLKHYASVPTVNHVLQGIFTNAGSTGRPEVASNPNNAITASYMGSVLNKLGGPAETEKPLKTGEVRGLHGVKLDLPEHGTAASLTSSHAIDLDRATEFVFAYVPAPDRPAHPAAAGDADKTHVAKIASPASDLSPDQDPSLEDTADVCAASGCKQLATLQNSASSQAAWTLPLASLGYQPRPQQQMVGLGESASVHFLGEDQLLLTFSLHRLLPRARDEHAWVSQPRSVRAVLLSRSDGHILRMQDWTVPDDIGPFVWGLADGRVLAHVGHELVAFGADLKPEQRVPLSGPLLFLSAAPEEGPLLVATVHEKHSQEEHGKLSAFLGPGVPVDEEYDLLGLNAELQPTGTKRLTTEPTRPALLRSSNVNVRQGHGREWIVEQTSWTGQSKVLAHLHSSCEVEVESLPEERLLMRGCPPTESATTWYRVLDTSGKTLLKGTMSFGDLLQQAESDRRGDLLAVAFSHFDHSVDRHLPTRAGEFTNLTVSVYETATGKQAFVTRVPQGSSQQKSISLSPSGDGLAVLTSGVLQEFVVTSHGAAK